MTPCTKELPGGVKCGKNAFNEIVLNTDIGRIYAILCPGHWNELPEHMRDEESFSFKR